MKKVQCPLTYCAKNFRGCCSYKSCIIDLKKLWLIKLNKEGY